MNKVLSISEISHALRRTKESGKGVAIAAADRQLTLALAARRRGDKEAEGERRARAFSIAKKWGFGLWLSERWRTITGNA